MGFYFILFILILFNFTMGFIIGVLTMKMKNK